MSRGYVIASAVMLILFVLTAIAAYAGWGLDSDASAEARSRSVRSGSLHGRSYYGGGPGFGK